MPNLLKSCLRPLTDNELQDLILKARTLTRQRFGRVIQLYAPLYLSNECIDTCTYCGFSRTNPITRKTLPIDQVGHEADYLITQGFKHILLVAGEHPEHVSPDYLNAIVKELKPKLASLSIEVSPFREEVYKRLIETGLDGIVIYQETYDRDRYADVHLAGPKKNYERRLQAPEEALKAGIHQLGMGILLGLSDWRKEVVRLVNHIEQLRKKYWQTEITISLPRLRPCASDYRPPCPVSDRDFVQVIAALRLALPDIGIVLSTRESPALRDSLIGLGVTRMSAGSKTEPGGYLHPEEELKQFEIEDHRSVKEVMAAITSKDYEPVWKDWEKMM